MSLTKSNACDSANFLFFSSPGLNNGRLPACVPAAHMSTAPAGGGRENQLYVLLVGATCVGGAIYVRTLSLSEHTVQVIRCKSFTKYQWLKTVLLSQAYRTVKGDSQRYQDRIDEISSRPLKTFTEEPATPTQSEPPGERINQLILGIMSLLPFHCLTIF